MLIVAITALNIQSHGLTPRCIAMMNSMIGNNDGRLVIGHGFKRYQATC